MILQVRIGFAMQARRINYVYCAYIEKIRGYTEDSELRLASYKEIQEGTQCWTSGVDAGCIEECQDWTDHQQGK